MIGKRVGVGIGKESTPGTAVAPTHWVPAREKMPNITVEYASNDSDYGTIVKTVESEPVYSKGEPEIKGLIFDKIFGHMCLAALGSCSTSTDDPEAGVNTHTFSILNSEEHPSYTIAFKDANEDYCHPYSKLQELVITYKRKSLIEYSAKYVSQEKESDTNTVAYDTDEYHFNSGHVSFKLAATKAALSGASAINVEDLTFKINKEILEQDSLGNTTPVNIYNGGMDFEMEVELLMDNTTYQALYTAGTLQAAELKLENTDVTIGAATNPSITIQLNAVNFEGMDKPYKTEEIVRIKLKAKCHYKLADAEAIEIVVVNTETSY